MASFQLYLANRTLSVRNALVEQYLPLVRAVVTSISKGRIRRGDQDYVCTDDLEAAGAAGLIRGVEQFDPLRGVKPETFLSHKIRSSVLDELRRLDPLSRSDRESVNREAPSANAEKGLRLGGAVGITEEVADSLAAPSCEADVKEALRAAFQGFSPRQVYALVLHRLEAAPVRWVQSAISATGLRVAGSASKILRMSPTYADTLTGGVSSSLRYREQNATKARILRTLLQGRKSTGRPNYALHPRDRQGA